MRPLAVCLLLSAALRVEAVNLECFACEENCSKPTIDVCEYGVINCYSLGCAKDGVRKEFKSCGDDEVGIMLKCENQKLRFDFTEKDCVQHCITCEGSLCNGQERTSMLSFMNILLFVVLLLTQATTLPYKSL